MELCYPDLGWVYPSQLRQSKNSITDIPSRLLPSPFRILSILKSVLNITLPHTHEGI